MDALQVISASVCIAGMAGSSVGFLRDISFFPKQCLHNGVLTFRVKELVADRNGARGGGTGSRCGLARIPLRFDAPAVASREFRPLVASSGLFRGGHLGCRPQRRARWDGSLVWMLPCGFARIPLRFDAPAVVSREFRCISMLPLWFRAKSGPNRIRPPIPLWSRANSVAFRCSRCGFARIPASRGLFRPLQGGPLRLPTATARAVGRVLGLDAPAVVSREFRCVSMLPLWFRANSVAFRCSRCGFARNPAPIEFGPPRTSVLFVPGSVGALLAFFGLFLALGSTPA